MVLHAVHVVVKQTNSVLLLVVPAQESTCSVTTVSSISHGHDFVSWLELHCNICHSDRAQADMTALLPATTSQETSDVNGLCHHKRISSACVW